MMKALGILVRLLCSLVVLLAVALYLEMGTCAIAPEQFAAGITPEHLAAFFTSLNWVSITAGALVLLALLRILDMAWNIAFCLSFVPVLFCGLWTVWGPAVALPVPLQGNACMTAFCTLPQDYPVPALIVMGIFAMGWLASTAPFRIAITSLVSFGLWYGVTFLAHHVIVCRWADTPTPAQPEVLAMVLANPWLIAAIPGAFFLVYAVLVAFFETFLSRSSKKKPAPAAQEKPAEEKKETPAPADNPAEQKPVAAPAPKPLLKKPVLKTLAPATNPAEEKPDAPTPAEKPAEEKPAAPAPAEKNAEEKPEALAEKTAEEKPADKA